MDSRKKKIYSNSGWPKKTRTERYRVTRLSHLLKCFAVLWKRSNFRQCFHPRLLQFWWFLSTKLLTTRIACRKFTVVLLHSSVETTMIVKFSLTSRILHSALKHYSLNERPAHRFSSSSRLSRFARWSSKLFLYCRNFLNFGERHGDSWAKVSCFRFFAKF